jgi:hypothetical protein
LWELAAQLGQLIKRLAAGDYTHDNAVPEERPFGRSQALKTDRLRQPGPIDNKSRDLNKGSALRLLISVQNSRDRHGKKHLNFAFYSLNFTQGEIRFGR